MSSSRQGIPSVTNNPDEVCAVITLSNPFFTPLFRTISSTVAVMSMASSDLRDWILIRSSLMIICGCHHIKLPGRSRLGIRKAQEPFGVPTEDFGHAPFCQRETLERGNHILDLHARVVGAEDDLVS